MKAELAEVKNFWNDESCGERNAEGDQDKDYYLSETKIRYKLEPYIEAFADFPSYAGQHVLEVGVGMGSDHSQIAKHHPKKLVGLDLTERAIEHTQKRFDILNLETELHVANAEELPFENEIFDSIYSYGVIHHSPNTKGCVDEIFRVLKVGGTARIMIYHKRSLTGLMLWIRYGLFRLKPLMSLRQIYDKYLESPGTKAYSVGEAKRLFNLFSSLKIDVQLSHGDLLLGDVGQRHKGPLLSLAKVLFPRRICIFLDKLIPVGLFLLIKATK